MSILSPQFCPSPTIKIRKIIKLDLRQFNKDAQKSLKSRRTSGLKNIAGTCDRSLLIVRSRKRNYFFYLVKTAVKGKKVEVYLLEEELAVQPLPCQCE